MNAHNPAVEGAALALAATNADILRAVRDGQHLSPGAVGHACGRPTKNMARDMGVLVREGLVHKEDADHFYELTATGRAALQGVDIAQGQLEPAPTAETNDVILLRHDQIRANPLNPRKKITPEEIAALADAIEAADDVLQNLVVFPADAEGFHVLSAGERRWRAVGLLIEQGRWAADRRLRAIERENTEGQTSFLALVENGARQNLALIEEARAYLTLVEETGWSARKAALNTGRDVKTVQEMLKVLREAAPEDIAAHEANAREFTWERLRNSVKTPQEREGDAAQLDIEQLTGADHLTAHDKEVRARLHESLPTLNARQLLALVELADKIDREPYGDPRWPKTRIGAHYPDRSGTTQPLIEKAGVGFTSGGGDPDYASVHRFTLEWLDEVGLRASKGDRVTILGGARLKAIGAERAAAARLSDRYITPWINEDHQPERPASPAPVIGGGPAQAQPPKPPKAAASPDHQLTPVQRLTMLEIGHKTLSPEDSGGWVRCRKYWLDQTASELQALGFVVFSHTVNAQGPHVGMPSAGRAWVDANSGGDLDAALDAAWKEAGRRDLIGWLGQRYATEWLNVEAAESERRSLPQVATSEIVNAMADDEFAEAEVVLGEIVRGLDHGDDLDFAAAFDRAGIQFPLQVDHVGRCIASADEEPIIDLVGHGDLAEDMLTARLLLLTAALNNLGAAITRAPKQERLTERTKAEPAVPMRRSITPDYIVCLEDGLKLPSIALHVRTVYGLTPDDYRTKWGLPRDYPMVAPNVSKTRYEEMRALGIDPWKYAREEDPPEPDEADDSKCCDCGASVSPGVGHLCDSDPKGPRCGKCFGLTPCGKGEHGEGCATQVVSDGEA